MPSFIRRALQYITFLFLSLIACGGLLAKDNSETTSVHVSFEISKIGEYVDSNDSFHRIYVAQETSGYLSKLGAGIGINTVIDVGSNAYLVIDPGPDGIYTKKLIETLRNTEKSIQGKRVVLVNSVARPEHVLANSSLSKKNTIIYATKNTQANMKARCPNCRKRLAAQLENKQILNTPLKIPNKITFSGSFLAEFPNWQVFEYAGRTESDLALWNSKTRTLYAGGLAYQNSILDLSDGDSTSWLSAITQLLDLNPNNVIGVGDGKIESSTQILWDTKNYLENLRNSARQDFLSGGDAASADKCCKLEQYKNTPGYPIRHPLNIQHVWREIELEEMSK